MRRILISLLLLCAVTTLTHAQNQDFISVTSSANSTQAALVIDNNPQSGWVLDARMLKNEQHLMLALQTPGNVNALQIEADGLTKADLQKLLSIYITYDLMNPGNPVKFTVEDDKTFNCQSVMMAYSDFLGVPFDYSDIKATVNSDGTLDVEATVKNTGKIAGDEVVQLYITDMYSSVKTRVMELKDFTRINLAAGESKTVKFKLTPYQLSLLNVEMDRVVESGQFKVMVGGKSPSFVARDRIKDSVGYKKSSEGVNTVIDYPYDYLADFDIAFAGTGMDRLNKHKAAFVKVKNNGNITDAGKITMYVDGVQSDDVHHFELDP